MGDVSVQKKECEMKMMKYILLAYLLVIPELAMSAVVTWKASGTITSSLSGAISVGDSFNLYYTFDSLVSDSNSSETRGMYQIQTVTIDMPRYSATTSKSSTITIDNSSFGNFDRYTLNTSTPNGFYAHNAQTIGGRELISIVTEYTDNQAVLFSNDSLPITPFNLSLVESARLEMLFSNDWQSEVAFDAQWVNGEITSLTAVPLPPAIYLFISSLLVMTMKFRKKR